MSEANMQHWDALKHPPGSALKKITGGRLSGMTDIKPQWRYEIMTRTFGPCGEGWKYAVDKLWTEPGSHEQVMAFALVSVYHKTAGGQWSDPTPGIGGSMLVMKEAGGLHTSDEGFKMAVTDALSVALKLLGVGADVYNGYWDGSKYKDGADNSTSAATKTAPTPASPPQSTPTPVISSAQKVRLFTVATKAGKSEADVKACLKLWGYEHSKDIKKTDYEAIIASLTSVSAHAPRTEDK